MIKDWKYKGKATAWNGISNWLVLNGLKGGSNADNINRTIKEFLIESKLPFDKRNNGYSNGKNARLVQKNWELFKRWYNRCPQCNGTGEIERNIQRDGFPEMDVPTVCSECNGSGQIIK